MSLKHGLQLAAHLRSRLACFGPYCLKVRARAEILRDSESVVEVEHYMPPTAGHKHRLARLLDERQWTVRRLGRIDERRVDVREPRDGLSPALVPGGLYHLLGGAWPEASPQLVPREQCIPCRRAKRVDVDVRTRALRAEDEPTIRGPSPFSNEPEEVIREEAWQRPIMSH